jgi:hypothetical protein
MNLPPSGLPTPLRFFCLVPAAVLLGTTLGACHSHAVAQVRVAEPVAVAASEAVTPVLVELRPFDEGFVVVPVAADEATAPR